MEEVTGLTHLSSVEGQLGHTFPRAQGSRKEQVRTSLGPQTSMLARALPSPQTSMLASPPTPGNRAIPKSALSSTVYRGNSGGA